MGSGEAVSTGRLGEGRGDVWARDLWAWGE